MSDDTELPATSQDDEWSVDRPGGYTANIYRNSQNGITSISVMPPLAKVRERNRQLAARRRTAETLVAIFHELDSLALATDEPYGDQLGEALAIIDQVIDQLVPPGPEPAA